MANRGNSIISTALLAAAAGCFLFGAGVTVVDVGLRTLFGHNVPAAIELTCYSIGLGALLSFPVCYATRTHVTAKLLSELNPGWLARGLGIIGATASAVFAVILFWIVSSNTISRLGSPETTPDLRLPVPPLLVLLSLVLAISAAAAIAGMWFEVRRKGGDR